MELLKPLLIDSYAPIVEIPQKVLHQSTLVYSLVQYSIFVCCGVCTVLVCMKTGGKLRMSVLFSQLEVWWLALLPGHPRAGSVYMPRQKLERERGGGGGTGRTLENKL